MTGSPVTARSNVNVALVKYWGKRDPSLNLPATGSISLTLEGLSVEAEVGFAGSAAPAADDVTIDGEPARGRERERLVDFLDLVRAQAGSRESARVVARSPGPRGARPRPSAAAVAAP